jgi:hypothetical protein
MRAGAAVRNDLVVREPEQDGRPDLRIRESHGPSHRERVEGRRTRPAPEPVIDETPSEAVTAMPVASISGSQSS